MSDELEKKNISNGKLEKTKSYVIGKIILIIVFLIGGIAGLLMSICGLYVFYEASDEPLFKEIALIFIIWGTLTAIACGIFIFKKK